MKAKLFFLLTAIAIQSAFFVSCGNDTNGAPDATSTSVGIDVGGTTASDSVGEIRLTPFPASPEFPNAGVSVGYENGRFMVQSLGFPIGSNTPDFAQKMSANSKDGQHIQLIIDNQSFDDLYSSSLEKAVPDGVHYVLALLTRSYYEGVKSDNARMAIRAEIKDGTSFNSPFIEEPILFYSRPKGKYVGKAETDKVLLDFYLLNTKLSPTGNKVKVLINGEKEFTIDEWKPFYIEGLPMGDNKVKLTLVDKDGNPVKTPLNPVEQVFTLL